MKEQDEEGDERQQGHGGGWEGGGPHLAFIIKRGERRNMQIPPGSSLREQQIKQAAAARAGSIRNRLLLRPQHPPPHPPHPPQHHFPAPLPCTTLISQGGGESWRR